VDFFVRYGTGWPTTTTVRSPTARSMRKGHAVAVDSVPGAASLCGRSHRPADVDDREHDFAALAAAHRCAVCAGLLAAIER
jgi:hypothetical protein